MDEGKIKDMIFHRDSSAETLAGFMVSGINFIAMTDLPGYHAMYFPGLRVRNRKYIAAGPAADYLRFTDKK